MGTTMPGNKTRAVVVREALRAAVTEMAQRSTHGGITSAKFRVAMLAYSYDVFDLLTDEHDSTVDPTAGMARVLTIDKLKIRGTPKIEPMDRAITDTRKAFRCV